MSRWPTLVYLAVVAGLAWMCFIRPAPDDFDRYIYDALVRGRQQPLEAVYAIVKHENPRAEASGVLDSPISLGHLEPLYAIRPMYIEAITLFHLAGIPIQKAITLISALSLFGIGVVLLIWTRRPLFALLFLATPEVVNPARIGTPDALGALVSVAGLLALVRNSLFLGIVLLLLSVWVRTDNVLLAVCALGWLMWERTLTPAQGMALILLAVASVWLINHYSGNYGWAVLFRYSFVGGRYPARIAGHVTLREYVAAVVANSPIAAPHLAIGVLLGAAAWCWQKQQRPLLLAAGAAAAAHFLLFPSPETRYLLPSYLVAGAVFIAGLGSRTSAVN